MSRRLELVVTPELAGVKVDTLLKRHLHLSGTVVRRVKWLEDGILVDGLRVNTRFCPAAGQVLSVRLSDPVRNSGIVPAPGPLDIVHEDDDLIVLNKAAGVPVHPGPGHFSDTLGNFLVDYYEKTGQEADFHPVHRLDRGTSGLLVAAKHPHAQEVLKNQLHTEDFRRVYLAVCEGVPAPPSGVIDAPWARAPAPSWSRWSGPTAGPPGQNTGYCAAGAAGRWCPWSWRQAAPIKFGSTWPTSAIPSPATSSTARRTEPSFAAPPSTRGICPSGTP